MNRIVTLLLVMLMNIYSVSAQHPDRVNLGEASSAMTSTANALNTLYHNVTKIGDVDPAISESISSISGMAFSCREAIVNLRYNASTMSEEKKENIVATSKAIEADVDAIILNDTKEDTLYKLKSIETKMISLSKSLGIIIKKKK